MCALISIVDGVCACASIAVSVLSVAKSTLVLLFSLNVTFAVVPKLSPSSSVRVVVAGNNFPPVADLS